MKMMKKIGVSLLTLCLAISAFLTTDVFNAVEAKTELVNVALLGTAKTENGHNSDQSGNHVVENVNDVQSVTLDKPVVKLEVGNTSQLEVKVLPETAENKTVQWTSSDNDVATVVDGLITAKKSGTATITVTSSNGKKASSPLYILK